MEERDPLAQLDAGPIFVVGVARSGTTWVHDALRTHPLVGALFETELFEEVFGVLGLLHDSNFAPTPRRVGRLADREAVVAEIRALAGRLFARGLKPHHRYLVEKTPGHVLRMPLIAEIFPDARFIHVIRDGRDVCVSIRAADRSWERTLRRLPGSLGIAQAARRWQHQVRVGRADARRLPGRVLEVRYEQLRADPRAGYRTMMDFALIPYDDEIVERMHEKVDFDTTERANDATGFYRGGRVGDWERELGLVDRLAFEATAGDALVELGYEPPGRRWIRR
jgi:hypothetical protein